MASSATGAVSHGEEDHVFSLEEDPCESARVMARRLLINAARRNDMKKSNRKRLELEREVVKVLMAAIPAANLKYVQGGSRATCSNKSCVKSGCPPTTSERAECDTAELA